MTSSLYFVLPPVLFFDYHVKANVRPPKYGMAYPQVLGWDSHLTRKVRVLSCCPLFTLLWVHLGHLGWSKDVETIRDPVSKTIKLQLEVREEL